MTKHWYLRVLPRTIVAGILATTLLSSSAMLIVAEAWRMAAKRSESAQLICAFVAVLVLSCAASILTRNKQRAVHAGVACAALVGHGFALVGLGQAMGVLLVGIAPLAYGFAKSSAPPKIVFRYA